MARRAVWLKVWHFLQIQPKLPSDKKVTLCLSTRLEITGYFYFDLSWEEKPVLGEET